jgi:type II secretory ATPase GspE/PulE/Tfp pilus assembly ATPase PilB-like protein
MIQTLAMDAVIPVSVVKPILGLGLLWVWGRWATIVDKDAAYFNQNRKLWNAVQIGGAALGMAVLLLIPMFFAGYLLSLLIIGGTAAAYVVTRNKAVPESSQWRLNADLWKQAMAERREEAVQREATLRFVGPPAAMKSVPMPDQPSFEAHLTLEQFIEPAIRRKAQRIELAASENQFAAQISIDGVDYRLPTVPLPKAMAAMDYLKQHCKLDIQERRKKQQGQCKVEIDGLGQHTLKMTTAGSSRGITFTILVNPAQQLGIAFKDLGLLESQNQALFPVLAEAKGVVLVAGPSRSGRTATLYGLLSQHDPYTLDVHTMETEIERDLEGITQHAVDPADLPKKLDSLLLRDPQVVGIGQLSDAQVAQSMARAAVEGKRLYATVKADDTFAALKLWIKACGEADLAAKSIEAVIAQRLVRRLCPMCRQKYTPEADLLRKLNLPADRISQLFKAGGKVILKKDPEPCPSCQGVGYQGRVAVYEVMVIDDEARKLVRTGKLDDLRTHLRRQKMLWLGEAALSRAVSGMTSISEVSRALGQDQQTETAAATAS